MRTLDPLFAPRAVAVVGAGERPGSLGRVVLDHLRTFDGAVYPLHPRLREVDGRRAFARASELPEPPDLAVLAVAAERVPEAAAGLLARGARVLLVLAAGYSETGTAAGREREQALADACRGVGARLVGPNAMGFHLAHDLLRLDAGFSRAPAAPGPVAVISQSGSVAEWFMLRLRERGIGPALTASVGTRADVTDTELLEEIPSRLPGVDRVLVYAERIEPPLADALLAFPGRVVLLPGGPVPATIAPLATAGLEPALARLVDGAVPRRPGPAPRVGPCLAVHVVTNAGGPAVLALRELARAGIALAPAPPGIDALLPPTAPRGAPLDLLADADPDRFRAVLAALPAGEPRLVLFFHPVLTDGDAVVDALLEELPGNAAPTAMVWMGGDEEPFRARLRRAGLLVAETPEEGARGLTRLLAET